MPGSSRGGRELRGIGKAKTACVFPRMRLRGRFRSIRTEGSRGRIDDSMSFPFHNLFSLSGPGGVPARTGRSE